MKMPDFPTLVIAFVAGLILGAFFFGGLWWTVQRGLKSENPAIWFFGSMMLRTALIVVAFYYVAQGHWSNLVACLVGFLLGRFFIVRRLAGDPAEKSVPEETEADVAHQS
jgi:F1F0 ATPase subunit 2